MTALAMVEYNVRDEMKSKKRLVNNMVRMGQQVPLREAIL